MHYPVVLRAEGIHGFAGGGLRGVSFLIEGAAPQAAARIHYCPARLHARFLDAFGFELRALLPGNGKGKRDYCKEQE